MLDPAELENKLSDWHADIRDGWSLYELTGGRVPILDDIQRAAGRRDLTPVQEHLIQQITTADDPAAHLFMVSCSGAGMCGIYTAAFGTWPTVADIQERVSRIDQAVSHPLPSGLQVQRGLRDLDFMLAGASPHKLQGTTWCEPGYTSASLGPDLNVVGVLKRPYAAHLHLDVPKGTPGLWIGRESAFPDQREILFPRELTYAITKVWRTGTQWHLRAIVVG